DEVGERPRVPDLVDRDDVRVAEPRERLRLATETAGRVGVRERAREERLDRDDAAHPVVPGAVDDPHPALPELRQEDETREASPRVGAGRRALELELGGHGQRYPRSNLARPDRRRSVDTVAPFSENERERRRAARETPCPTRRPRPRAPRS